MNNIEIKLKTKPRFRMSGAGRCARALAAEKLGIEAEPFPAWLKGMAEEGNLHEGWIISWLKDNGWNVFSEQLEVVIKQKTFNLVGHIDGLIKKEGDRQNKLLEIKTMSQFEFDRWQKEGFGGFRTYAVQAALYLSALGLQEVLYVIKNRNTGYKLVNVYNIKELGVNVDDVLAKLADVLVKVESGKLCKATYDPYTIECKRCRYKAICIEKWEALTMADECALGDAVESYVEGKRLEKEAKMLISNASSVFKLYTEKHPEKAFSFDGYHFQMVEVGATHVAYDRKAYSFCNVTKARGRKNE